MRYAITNNGKTRLAKAENYQAALGLARKLSVEYYVTYVYDETGKLCARFDDGKETRSASDRARMHRALDAMLDRA